MNKEVLLQAVFSPIAEEIARENLSKALSKGQLLVSQATYIKKEEEVYLTAVDQAAERIGESFALAAELLQKYIETLSPGRKETIVSDMRGAFSKKGRKGKKEEMQSLQTILGLSNDTLLFIYQTGRHYFEEGEYRKAGAIFFLLTFLNHLVSDYWLALGMTQQKEHQDKEAIASLSLAAELNPENPMPHYHLANLYCQQKDFPQAKIEVEKLAKFAKEDRQWCAVVEEIQHQIRKA